MPGMDLSDNQLATLAGAGDAAAFQTLFERYQHPVYNFVYRLVENTEDASDIVQDAFIKMHGALGTGDIQNFSAYLYRTAKNLAFDEMRRRTRFADVDQEILAPEDPNIYADPQRALLLGEQMEKVRHAAAQLNENQRAALVLKELEGMDYDGMAEVLGSNSNAVGALLSRARLRLREELRMAQIKTDSCPEECEGIVPLLSPFIDGELTPAEEGAVSSHLEDCIFCNSALAEMREASHSFRMFIPVIPPPGVARAVTGNLEQLAGQGSPGTGQADGLGETGGSGQGLLPESPALDGTRVYPAPTAQARRSLVSRVLSRKMALFAGALAAMIILSAFLLAEDTDPGRDEESIGLAGATTAINDGSGNGAGDTGQASGTATSSATQTSVGSAPGATTPSTGAPQAPGTPGQPEGQPAPAAPAVTVVSGLVSPNPVYELDNATYTAVINGSASSVTAKLVSTRNNQTLTEVQLYSSSSGSGQETWSATGTIPAHSAGTYSVIVTATGADGQSDSRNVGNLVISSTIY